MMALKKKVHWSHRSTHPVFFDYFHTHLSVVIPFPAALVKETYLSRWQLSIQPQGRWRDRRKPLSSSLWLSLNLCLSLCARSPSFLLTEPSHVCRILQALTHLSETILQGLFTVDPLAHLCFPLPYPFSPITFHSVIHFWVREQIWQQKMDLGLWEVQVSGTWLSGTNFKTILQWC